MNYDLKDVLKSMKEYKYYLKAFYEEEWTEVSQDEFIRAERHAGFRPKYGTGPVATGGFSGGGMKGRVEFRMEEE